RKSTAPIKRAKKRLSAKPNFFGFVDSLNAQTYSSEHFLRGFSISEKLSYCRFQGALLSD
ncbi:hypothetical protein, partial [Neobacillus dielmonensis]|uniref:hypothetical protein n=1 Tax=Neobacillus dielmonensis TaxID=1347369 RepID=UPI001C117156